MIPSRNHPRKGSRGAAQHAVCAGLAVIALVALPPEARADSSATAAAVERGFTWGIPTLEVTFTASLLMRFTWGIPTLEVTFTASLLMRFTMLPPHPDDVTELGLTGGPILLGTAVGWIGAATGASTRVPLAAHGALFTGLDVGVLTAVIQGLTHTDPPGLHFNWLTLGAALVGMVPGALIGGLEVEGTEESRAFLAAPPAGFVGSVLLSGAILIVSFLSGDDLDGHAGEQVLGWTIFAGTSAGLAIAIGAVADSPEAPR